VLNRARSVGWQVGSDHVDTGKRRREVVEVSCKVGPTDITQLADTNGHRCWPGRSIARVGREIASKFPLGARSDTESPSARRGPRLVASNAPAHVIRKVGLGKFAVIYAIDTAFDLAAHDLRHCRFQPLVEFGWVIRFTVRLGEDHVPEIGDAAANQHVS
jgi:hypothetical protein